MADGRRRRQPQSIFEQALDRSTPGFDSLLGVVQQETNRIERNKQLAQQREMKEELMEFQSDLQVDVFNKTQAVENEKNRELQKELALLSAIQQKQQASAEAEQKAKDELGEAKDEARKEGKSQWEARYRPVIDEGFQNVPIVEVEAIGDDPNNLQVVYETSNGQRFTPNEFEENYGWTVEAQKYVDRYSTFKTKDMLEQGTTEKEIEGTLTNALGQPTTIQDIAPTVGKSEDEEDDKITETLTKRYLGKEEAAEKIAQLRAGNKDVLADFRTGRLDFNTIGEGEGDIVRGLRSNIQNLQDKLEQFGDKYTGFMSNFSIVPFYDFPSDTKIKHLSVDKVERELKDDDSDLHALFQNIKAQYPQLDGATTGKPWSELYINPNWDQDTPVKDFFITKERFDKEMGNVVPGKGDDVEVTNQTLNKKRAQQLHKSWTKSLRN